MGKRLFAPSVQPSRRLPPPEAWKRPDIWLDPERRAENRFYLPVDDRQFVIPDASIELVLELFDPDYRWPVDPNHPETRPDIHHFYWEHERYKAANFGGNTIPMDFCELPSNKGKMPRMFHNVLHDITREPIMPLLADMKAHIRAYMLARQAFAEVVKSARLAAEQQKNFPVRRKDVARNPGRLSGRREDVVGEEILASLFDRHFRDYRRRLEAILASSTLVAAEVAPLFPEVSQLPSKMKPHVAVKKIGRLSTFKAVNYMPLIPIERAA